MDHPLPLRERIVRHLPRWVREIYCEITGHRTYDSPSGLFTYCLRCHSTIKSPLQ